MDYTYQMIDEHGTYIGKAFKSSIELKEGYDINYENQASYRVIGTKVNVVHQMAGSLFLKVRRM